MTLEWGESQLLISEINENELTPFIRGVSLDTFPVNTSCRIIIYGENFSNESAVEILGTSNIVIEARSPSQIEISLITGTISGDFPINVINKEKKSDMWGNAIFLHIIPAVGGYLPLLDTWIDCRVGGSPDGMIGNISQDSLSTWNRGNFGYGLSSMTSYPSNWNNFFRFADYYFNVDFDLQVEMIVYFSSIFSNFRWGLLCRGDSGINAPTGQVIVPNSYYFYLSVGIPAAPEFFTILSYKSPGIRLNRYTKIIFRKEYMGIFDVSINDFSTTATINERFFNKGLWDELIDFYKRMGFYEFELGCTFFPGGSNPENNSFLTAFKISWG